MAMLQYFMIVCQQHLTLGSHQSLLKVRRQVVIFLTLGVALHSDYCAAASARLPCCSSPSLKLSLAATCRYTFTLALQKPSWVVLCWTHLITSATCQSFEAWDKLEELLPWRLDVFKCILNVICCTVWRHAFSVLPVLKTCSCTKD